MKVKELIEILSKLDKEKRVLINSDEYICDIGDIEPNLIGEEKIYVIEEALT